MTVSQNNVIHATLKELEVLQFMFKDRLSAFSVVIISDPDPTPDNIEVYPILIEKPSRFCTI
jgi:hypothetical protein